MPEEREKQNVTDQDKLQRFVEGERLPDLWNIFDMRGEFHCFISNKSIMIKKDSEQYENLMRITSKMGSTQEMTYNTMVKNVDEQQAVKILEDEGYYVEKADEQDFRELQSELDKLLTIKKGTMDKYN